MNLKNEHVPNLVDVKKLGMLNGKPIIGLTLLMEHSLRRRGCFLNLMECYSGNS